MTDLHKRQLVAIGLLVALGVPLVLSALVAGARFGGLDLVLTMPPRGPELHDLAGHEHRPAFLRERAA